MSRIGKQPIPVPDKVKVAISGQTVSVEGPKGSLSKTFNNAAVVKKQTILFPSLQEWSSE